MKNEYQIKIETFEGPLELLLELIEKKKLFINEISLAKISDDYVAHLKSFEKLPLDFVTNFLIVAATLILIKSKSLLPDLSLTPEETQDIEELEMRLREYQRMRELSVHVKKMFGQNIAFFKNQSRSNEVVFAPSEEMTSPNLYQSMREVISRFPKKTVLQSVVVKKIISLEEVMDTLSKRITANLKMSFNEFAGVGKEEKVNVIVTFLAMLELVKQGMLLVTQERSGDDIHMETGVLDTPQYGRKV
ncbi:MAG: segregation/condensation protein A [Patescibacteria group bacterium]